MGDEAVHRLLCEAHGALAVGDLAQEVADEQRHVLAPFGQARQVDREDGETVEEVLAETAMADRLVDVAMRSEEHTSELQSLMRISYAVFCLKKKKNAQMKSI